MDSLRNTPFTESELLPLSAIQHYLYCPRRCALVHIEQAWSENRETAVGHVFHEKVHTASTENRKMVRIARDLRVRSLCLGISGNLDLVEFHRIETNVTHGGNSIPGVGGHWSAFPIEYKSGGIRHERPYEAQLCAQAMCLEEMLGFPINAGALYYGESHKRYDVLFVSSLRQLVCDTTQLIRQLITDKITPAPCNDARCTRCSMNDICMPKMAVYGTQVQRYIEGVLDEEIGR